MMKKILKLNFFKFSYGKFFNFPLTITFISLTKKKFNLNYLFISALSPPLPTLHEFRNYNPYADREQMILS